MILDPVRLVIGGSFLFYAAILDVRTRRVPNRVWVLMGAIGIILMHLHILLEGGWYHHFIFFPILTLYIFPFIELEEKADLRQGIITPSMWYGLIVIGFTGVSILLYYGGGGFFTLTLLGTAVFVLLVYLMYFTGLIFGGADAKGMMAITLLVPFYPEISIFPLFVTEVEAIQLVFTFPVVILTLSVVSFAFLPLAMAVHNLTRGDIGKPMFLGYRMALTEIPERYVWLMEKPQYKYVPNIKLMTMVGETSGMERWLKEQMFTGEIRTVYFPTKNASESLELDLAILKRGGKDEVWVTPKIPFMVAILAGYFISFIFGNLLFGLMDWIVG